MLESRILGQLKLALKVVRELPIQLDNMEY